MERFISIFEAISNLARIMNDVDILVELREIKEEIAYIKEHMVDIDYFLTPKEENLIEDALKEHERGETVKMTDFKRDE